MSNKKFSITGRLSSFRHAFSGVRWLLLHEHNARVHVFAIVFVCIAGYLLTITAVEWMLIVLCIGMVVSAELFNTVAERISDFICPEKHPSIKIIKDLAAAGVLVTAITAFVIGSIIFIPRIYELLK